MTEIKFLKSHDRKILIKELEKIYGITQLPNILIEIDKCKIRAFSGNLLKEEIKELSRTTNVEIIGMYIINKENNFLRLTPNSLSLFKSQITKNIFNLSDKQYIEWIRTHKLQIKEKRGLVVMKYKNDLMEIALSDGNKIFTHKKNKFYLKKN